MFRSAPVMVLAFVLVSACARVPTDETPSGALELFLEAMGDAEDDPSVRERAFALLAPESQRRLRDRALLASSLSARRFEPWEMIAEGRYRLRFRPRESGGFEERIAGDRAIVVVRGDRPSERAEVPMVRANGHWRVHLSIPVSPNTRSGSRASADGGVAPR